MTGPDAARPVDGWPAAAVVTGMMLILMIPPSLLTVLGVNYATPNGGAWEKVHPGSDLILLGTAATALRGGTPLAWARQVAARFPGSLMLLAATAFLIVYLIGVLHVPFTPLIDTFVVPVVLFVALVDLAPRWRARLEVLLHLFLAGNAALGLVEFLTGWRLVPVDTDPGGATAMLADTTRAVGLLGHPLASAAMAGLYAVILMLGGGPRLPAAARLPAVGLQLMALAAFGGRTALVLTVVCASASALVGALRVLGGRRVDPRAVGLGLLLVPLGAAALVAVAGGGFFDTILDRFADDNGSASARHAIFDILPYLTGPELLWGPDPAHLLSLQHLVGIEVGIESFWLGFILTYGLLPSLAFFAAFGWFTAEVMRQADGRALVPLAFFLVIISGAISLASKSTMLEQFLASVLILLPRPRVLPARARLATA